MCAWDGFDSRNYKTYFLKKRECKEGKKGGKKREKGQIRANWAQMGDAIGFQWCPTTNVASIIPLQETSFTFLRISKKLKFLECLWFRSTVHSSSSTMSANQTATEVLNAEARGGGPISPFRLRNVVEELPTVTSLWEPPISPPPITHQRKILDTSHVRTHCSMRAGLPRTVAFFIHAFNKYWVSNTYQELCWGLPNTP